VTAIWSPHALSQLEEVLDLIARDRPRAAETWLQRLQERIAYITDFPQHGRTVPESRRDDLRQIQHPPYRIIYRVERARIVILSLRHGRRKWNATDAVEESE
jgi:plasmid stabilization system protein ParE